MTHWDGAARVLIERGNVLRLRVEDADAMMNDLVVEKSVTFEGPGKYEVSEPAAGLVRAVLEVWPSPM